MWVFVERRPVSDRTVDAQDGMTIGREDCDVLLPDPEVSRNHARMTMASGRVVVEDLGSRNGTFVNGARIEGATALSEGDLLVFGHTEWEVRRQDGAGAGRDGDDLAVSR